MLVFTIVLIILGNLLDYFTTAYGLKLGLSELNPLINRWGLLTVKLGVSTFMIVMTLFVPSSDLWLVALGVGIVYGFVVIWNLHEIWKVS
jgi:hypothetical protein